MFSQLIRGRNDTGDDSLELDYSPKSFEKDQTVDAQGSGSGLPLEGKRDSAAQDIGKDLATNFAPLSLGPGGNTELSGKEELDRPCDQSLDDSKPGEAAGNRTSPSSKTMAENSSSESDTSSSRGHRYTSPGEITASRKDIVVSRLMVRLKNLLDQIFREWLCQRAHGASGQEPQACQPEGKLSWKASGKQRAGKRQRDISDGQGGEGGDDDKGDDASQQKRRKEDSKEQTRFACPFFKHNQGNYRQPEWSCRWPGWPSFHRVREHLYRRHTLPKYRCNRCCRDLKSSAQLLEHQRLQNPCQLRDQGPQEGIDEEQETTLRSKRMGKGKISEEEKWAEAYRVLFPGEEPVPSPYQGPLLMGTDHGFDKSDRTVLERFESFSQNEFPRRIRPQIEDLVDRAIEQTVTPEALTHVFGDVLKGMFETFRQRNSAETIQSEVSELVGVELEPPQLVDDQLESASPVLMQESEPKPEFLWLSNLAEQVPSQDLDFDFDEFMESLESGNKPDLTHGYGNAEAILGLPN
ncbi:hypothetical protein QQX98_011647 [Neonectria punicea]|uniref:C2H2-type domain-containing protein n=1 Tax=Neonectria punicea TaxID=979145 RepID=A0ABR1GL56_9HYPO